MQLVYETDEVIFSYKDLSLSGESTFDASGGLAIGIANGGGNYDDVDLSESSGQSIQTLWKDTQMIMSWIWIIKRSRSRPMMIIQNILLW